MELVVDGEWELAWYTLAGWGNRKGEWGMGMVKGRIHSTYLPMLCPSMGICYYYHDL